MSVPADLKALAPYIKRAEELDKDKAHPESPVVAYYCRQYAMELGIELREKAKDAEAVSGFLLGLIEELEAAKAALGVSRDEGEQLVYKFAMDVFERADSEDRGGAATKATARTFYAASVFMDALKQFGERGEEVDEKCRYAKWKAADIVKALKEGRVPTPGAPGEDQPDEDALSLPKIGGASVPDAPETTGGDVSPVRPVIPAAPTAPPPDVFAPPPSAVQPTQPPDLGPPPTYVEPTPPRGPPALAPARVQLRSPEPPPKAGDVSDAKIADALEYARFAVAALEIKDVNLALQRLHGALTTLSSESR